MVNVVQGVRGEEREDEGDGEKMSYAIALRQHITALRETLGFKGFPGNTPLGHHLLVFGEVPSVVVGIQL